MYQQPEKFDLKSKDITEEKKQQLKQLFPEVFNGDKIDFDYLKRELGEWVEPGQERFGLQWPGKADCMKIIQQPSIATLKPDRDESVNFDETENLFIEGDNLEVLKLLQKSYFGKVKMIYIDPPYNTGNEFIYPDDYGETLDTYLKYTGQKDEEGNWQTTNRDTDGRFHSRWLNMMYPRLFLAKNLLRDDGVIFISIDDNEVAHLRKLCDEIFGEENFLSNVIWQHSVQPKGYKGTFSVHHNHILAYQKSDKFDLGSLERTKEDNKSYSNPDNDPNGRWRSGDVRNSLYRPNLIYELETPSGKKIGSPENGWRWSKETMQKKIESGEIIFSNDETRIIRKIYLKDQDGRTPETIWFAQKVGSTREGANKLKELFDGLTPFDTSKPTKLIKNLIEISGLEDDDICLDFFGGSCSTAEGIIKYSDARFIMIQLPEKVDDSKPQGKDSLKLGIDNIADLGKERIRRVIHNIQNEYEDQSNQQELEIGKETQDQAELDLGFKVFKLDQSNFKVWDAPEADTEAEKLEDQLDVFADHITPEAERESILYELILKSGYPLSTKITQKEIDGYTLFSIDEGALLVYLDEGFTFEILEKMAEMEPNRVVCLDKSFSGEEADALKTNAVQLFKANDITFRTV
jgi:adenine-specific DNA-methyltransferase